MAAQVCVVFLLVMAAALLLLLASCVVCCGVVISSCSWQTTDIHTFVMSHACTALHTPPPSLHGRARWDTPSTHTAVLSLWPHPRRCPSTQSPS